MNLFLQITFGFITLAFLFITFVPMEKMFPAKRQQSLFRPHVFTDILFFVGQMVIWNGLVLFALSNFNDWLGVHLQGNFRATISSQPWILQAIEVIILSDFLIYWGHRLQHNNKFLWRFHKVHHSAEHLDWIAAYREHPLDTIYTVGIINLPALVLGFDLQAIIGFIAFRGIWAIFIHSNVRIQLGPLKKVIGSPDLHHWHHAKDKHAGNYANVSPLMDIMFGTYVCPPVEPESVGIQEKFPKNYFAQILHPLLPDRISRLPIVENLLYFKRRLQDSNNTKEH